MGCVATEGDTKRMKRLDGERGCVSNSSELFFRDIELNLERHSHNLFGDVFCLILAILRETPRASLYIFPNYRNIDFGERKIPSNSFFK